MELRRETSGMRRACVSLARGRSNTAAKEARRARCNLASPELKENKTTDLRHNVMSRAKRAY
jgi:hypothetical protein